MSDDEPVAPKPSSLSHPEAASLSFGGITALGFMRDKGGTKSGDKLLVVGASGAVGSAAVQLARESWRHRHRSMQQYHLGTGAFHRGGPGDRLQDRRLRYRAARSDQAAWDRARRPKLCNLACCPSLARTVSAKLQLNWSPEQIAGWLKRTFPRETHNQGVARDDLSELVHSGRRSAEGAARAP